MTSKERVMAVFSHQIPDVFPCGAVRLLILWQRRAAF